EAEFFGHFDVVPQRFVSRRRIKAIRPETLIERPELEIWFVVQQQAGKPFVILAERNLAHAEVALDGIAAFFAAFHRHLQTIQMRGFRRPMPGILYRHGDSAPSAY